jgi:PadR family transcriptional regulator PadR
MDTTQLLKGVLDLAVLAVVGERDGYGYDVVRRLRAAGLYRSGHLTSYVVPSEEGPHRKYYAVNEAGRAQLAASTGTWRSFTDAMDKLLGAGEEEAA